MKITQCVTIDSTCIYNNAFDLNIFVLSNIVLCLYYAFYLFPLLCYFLKTTSSTRSKIIKKSVILLARLLILIKKGGLLQLKFGVVGVGVNIYLWAR